MVSRFEVFQDQQQGWRWRLRHRNGNIIADSAEAYDSRGNCLRAIQSVRRNVLQAEVHEPDQVNTSSKRRRNRGARTGLTRRTLAKDRRKEQEARVAEPQIGPRLEAAG